MSLGRQANGAYIPVLSSPSKADASEMSFTAGAALLSDSELDLDSPTDSGLSDDDRCFSLGALLQNKWFDRLVIGMIVCNTALMAVEADYPEWTTFWHWTNNLFLSFFTVEISLRLCYYGLDFFRPGPDQGWNLFDFTIVGMGIFDLWVKDLLFPSGKNGGFKIGKLLLVLRTFRIMRVLRAVRLLRQFKELYQLAMGLFNSFSSVFWVAVLFTLYLLVCSIFITNVVGHQPDIFEDPEAIDTWFGTVPRTMDTLFVFLTCDDWSTKARMVNDVFPAMQVFWVSYMFIGAFTLLSLLTGLMADKMNEQREIEEDHQEEIESREMLRKLHDLKEHFMKDNDTGVVTSAQFKERLASPRVHKLLDDIAITIDEVEAGSVFEAMDANAHEELSWEEIAEGLVRYRAKECDLKDICWLEASLNQTVHILDRADGICDKAENFMKPIPQPAKVCTERIDDLQNRAQRLKDTVHNMQMDLLDFFAKYNYHPDVPKRFTGTSL
eukprot:TRINITY_DN81338_c0_g1_i1.p1 TRINITY_DN81338_c0_g1~~TRINITY_DN81338_c0_g1_i1.p1  ORF type:complete len:496 (-),score=94.98 TRINITY_DN81338_c0_g1_i1:94-1581(-)